jgi:hypothetical protein
VGAAWPRLLRSLPPGQHVNQAHKCPASDMRRSQESTFDFAIDSPWGTADYVSNFWRTNKAEALAERGRFYDITKQIGERFNINHVRLLAKSVSKLLALHQPCLFAGSEHDPNYVSSRP